MGNTNKTHHHQCDACLLISQQFYPELLVLPGFFAFLPQSLVFSTFTLSPLTEKTDLLTLNLVFANLLISTSIIFTFLSLKFVPWLYSYIWSSMFGMLCFAHPLAQALVCGERYLAVEHPIAFLKYRPLRYRLAVLAAMWGSVLLGNVTLTVICEVNVVMIAFFLQFECVLLAVSITLLTIASLLILKTLAQPTPGGKGVKSGLGANLKDRDSPKFKAFVLILLVEVMLLLCYLPPVIFFLSGNAFLRYTESCSFFLYNLWFVEIMSGLHCCKYLYGNNQWKKIYEAFLRVFRRRPG